jgi:hypothetical protein
LEFEVWIIELNFFLFSLFFSSPFFTFILFYLFFSLLFLSFKPLSCYLASLFCFATSRPCLVTLNGYLATLLCLLLPWAIAQLPCPITSFPCCVTCCFKLPHCLELPHYFITSCCFVASALLPFVSFWCFYFLLPLVALFRATSHCFVAFASLLCCFIAFCCFLLFLLLVASCYLITSSYLTLPFTWLPSHLKYFLTFCICCFIILPPYALLPCCLTPCCLVALLPCVGWYFLPPYKKCRKELGTWRTKLSSNQKKSVFFLWTFSFLLLNKIFFFGLRFILFYYGFIFLILVICLFRIFIYFVY